jgi:hypothetical protein
LKKIKVEDNAIELHNEFHDIQREYKWEFIIHNA